MTIEKINDNQIRCTLSRDDLESRQLHLSELTGGSEKARALFQDMMQQAYNQYGFETDNFPLMIEAIPISSECIVLVITKVEDPEELNARFSRTFPGKTLPELPGFAPEDVPEEDDGLFEPLFPGGQAESDNPGLSVDNDVSAAFPSFEQIMNFFSEALKKSREASEDTQKDLSETAERSPEAGESTGQDSLTEGGQEDRARTGGQAIPEIVQGPGRERDQAAGSKTARKESSSRKKTAKTASGRESSGKTAAETLKEEKKPVPTRIFCFKNMADLASLCALIEPFYKGESSLYKDRDGSYYLILIRPEDPGSQNHYDRSCRIACDFGLPVRYSNTVESYYKEHLKLIIKDQAVNTLCSLA